MGIIDLLKRGTQNVISWAMAGISNDPFERAHQARQSELANLIAYYNGDQRKPLRVSGMGKDYNVITNHAKTIVDRSVSMLVGAGVDFDLPGDGATEQEEYIAKVWEANKKNVLLHDLVQFGSIYGTPVIKIIPNAKLAMDGTVTHRLVALNPFNLSIFTKADDIDEVTEYVFRWNEDETNYREVTSHGIEIVGEDQKTSVFEGWTITTQKIDRSTNGRWSNISEEKWLYPFPPVVHGKNLPNSGNVYGYSDVEGIIDLQDKYNEAQSNINKILSLQAFAQKWVTGGKWPRTQSQDGHEFLDMAPDKALEFQSADTKVGILQPSGDLDSSRLFANDVRRDLYDISATVDAETVKDKVGAMTNFGLRVLFKNELAKNATKQLLYGDLLLQVNNRLLQLKGLTGLNADPGKVVFGDPLPTNDKEQIEVLQAEHDLGVTSLETAAIERGRDYKAEQERLAQEKQAAGNVGGNMLREFLAGKGQ